ncbi:MAG: TetR/AcrR family transcriptional regulator [Solirubrobacteraceae bacterium]
MRERSILDVAGRVFADAGYDRASMDRIAQLAGVSKPMLYSYFGSKEGLYVAYVKRTGGELTQRLVEADSSDQRVRLRLVIDEFLRFVEQHRDGWTVLYRELTTRRPVAEQVAQVRARIVAEVRRMLEGQDSDGFSALRAPASEAVAEAIVGAGESLANWWLGRADVARDDVAEWYVGLTRAAIAAANQAPG